MSKAGISPLRAAGAPAQAGRLVHIDAMRGLAALAVCWFHMSRGGALLPAGPLAAVSSYSYLGLEVFFVVSGFVIAMTLWSSGNGLGHYSRFLGKRMVRLQPPYFAAVVLTLFLNWLTAVLGTGPAVGPVEGLKTILTDTFYLSAIMSRPWVLVVAWTLAIEVQFYLLAGWVVPLTNPSRPKQLVLVLAALLAATWLVKERVWLPAYLPLFLLGWVAVWLRKTGLSWMSAAAVLAVALRIWALNGVPSLIASLLGFGALLINWKRVPALLTWLGSISYSLYLLHVPIGGRVVNLGLRWVPEGGGRIGLAVAGCLVAVGAAWLFWRWVEQPSHRLSRRLFASNV